MHGISLIFSDWQVIASSVGVRFHGIATRYLDMDPIILSSLHTHQNSNNYSIKHPDINTSSIVTILKNDAIHFACLIVQKNLGALAALKKRVFFIFSLTQVSSWSLLIYKIASIFLAPIFLAPIFLAPVFLAPVFLTPVFLTMSRFEDSFGAG